MMAGPGEDIASSREEVYSHNALSENRLSMNRLSMNRLNGWTLALNTGEADGMNETDDGREVLEYLARCALPEGDYLHVEYGIQVWDYPGVLGFAPNWEHEPLTLAERQLISACLLAHVNAFGISVPISVRHGSLSEPSVEESEVFYYGDGVFFGDLFEGTAKKYSCHIPARDYYDATAQALLPASGPDEDLRVCARPGADTACEIEYLGACDEVCAQVVADGQQWRYSHCSGPNGQVYDETLTVWLAGSGAESCDQAPIGHTCDPN
ncbi:hypothetical protein [Haliangium sp.]|uniref:hypothetical protein n=1 Tax=Haliangium sp. TaxID=2663208 RepID=UPI003D1438D7